jgi:hypothetical protein
MVQLLMGTGSDLRVAAVVGYDGVSGTWIPASFLLFPSYERSVESRGIAYGKSRISNVASLLDTDRCCLICSYNGQRTR